MKKWLALPSVILAGVALFGCSSGITTTSGQKAENQAQAADTQILVNNQPVPHYNYSQIRQNLIELENAQANGVQTTSFFFNQGVQDPIGSCPSIGAPIPVSDQLTNPQQVINAYDNGVSQAVISQQDPTGIYTGQGSGTYVICINDSGQAYASYWEGFVETVFGPASWNTTTHQVQLLGPPTGGFSKAKG